MNWSLSPLKQPPVRVTCMPDVPANWLNTKPDIYGSHTKNLEHFTKTPMFDVMGGFNGITWETVPELHRQRVKQVTPAFSTNSIRAKEPTMHKYIDLFVQSMYELGVREEGIELRRVRASPEFRILRVPYDS